MKPDFKILANDENVTETIRSRLLSLTVTDEAGTLSDTCTITLDDRAGLIELPRRGVVLSVAMGYQNALDEMGKYTVDAVERSGPPDTMTIRGRAADMRQSLKSCKARQWEGVFIDEIVSQIAEEHGLQPMIGESFLDISIPYIAQTWESDMHFLTRLAITYDAIAKPANGNLLFVKRGEAKSVSGKGMPEIALTKKDVSRWRVTHADRNQFATVRAHYRNLENPQDGHVEAGSGEPVFCLRDPFLDKKQAKDAADAQLKRFTRRRDDMSLTLPGNSAIVAECALLLAGFCQGMNGRWLVNRATHTLDSSGYVSSLEASQVEGEDTSSGN